MRTWNNIPFTWDEYISVWDSEEKNKQTTLGTALQKSYAVSLISGAAIQAGMEKVTSISSALQQLEELDVDVEAALQKGYDKTIQINALLQVFTGVVMGGDSALQAQKRAALEVGTLIHQPSIRMYNLYRYQNAVITTGQAQRFHRDEDIEVDLHSPIRVGQFSYELVWTFFGTGADSVRVYTDGVNPYSDISLLVRTEDEFRNPRIPVDESEYNDLFDYQVGNPLVVGLEDYIYLCAKVGEGEAPGEKPPVAIYYAYDEVA